MTNGCWERQPKEIEQELGAEVGEIVIEKRGPLS